MPKKCLKNVEEKNDKHSIQKTTCNYRCIKQGFLSNEIASIAVLYNHLRFL